MTNQALALPNLEGIPTRYSVPVADSFLRPLALAMLDDGLINDADVARRPASTMTLCTKALNRHWREVADRLSLFQWNLRIEENRSSNNFHWRSQDDVKPATAWALITTKNGPVSGPIVCVGPAVEWLEGLRTGLGQTILAALYDVLGVLPLVCTTSMMIDMGKHAYWQGCATEEDALEELQAVYDCTREEILTDHEFVSHKDLFGAMPEWAANPQRVLSRAQVNRAARGDRFASELVDAMDELWTALTFCGPFPNLTARDLGADLVDFTLIVRWTEDDSTGRVIDDYARFAYEGDYIEAASVTPIRLDDDSGHSSLREWLQKMHSTALLARAAERVLELLGSLDFVQPRTLVRVFA